MAIYKNQIISDDVRIMIETMNRAGFGRVVSFARIHRPEANIDKNVQIVRDAAKYGLTEAGNKHGTSRQYVLVLIKRFYRDALEVLRKDAEKDKG